MSSIVSLSDLWHEFKRSRVGLAGLAILTFLIVLSIIALSITSAERLRSWNDPAAWSLYPRNAMPAWVNLFSSVRLAEHTILNNPEVMVDNLSNIKQVRHVYNLTYIYDTMPTDIIIAYKVSYQGSSLMQVSITRPDGNTIEYARVSLPSNATEQVYESMLFSTDKAVQDSIVNYLSRYKFPIDKSETVTAVFSSYDKSDVLKGNYTLTLTFFLFNATDDVIDSKVVLGGRVYGLLGTDELRRDLSIGIVWGAPLALFIGISVASISVIIGMIYGIVSGYKGGRIDEGMMRLNDVVYALPALPLLILLAVSVGRSILLIVAYLIIFGWVGIAKVSRSIALQIKSLAYIEAAELMGQSSIKIITKHIFPQLLPYAFASIAYLYLAL
jgi:ABC-type dipeptide/oligopeptide/nickel transport systems, permease components